MPEARRRRAAEQARQSNLPSRRGEQVFPANHVGDLLQVIVDGGDELIRPVAEAIAHQQVAALLRWVLLLRPEELVEEPLGSWIHPHSPADIAGQGNVLLAAGIGVASLPRPLIRDARSLDVRPR